MLDNVFCLMPKSQVAHSIKSTTSTLQQLILIASDANSAQLQLVITECMPVNVLLQLQLEQRDSCHQSMITLLQLNGFQRLMALQTPPFYAQRDRAANFYRILNGGP